MTWTADVYCAVKKLFSHSPRDGDLRGGREGGKCPVTWNDWIIAPRGPGARVGNYFAAPGKWAGGRGTESSGMPMDGARTMRRPGCLGASRINIAFRGDVRPAIAGHSLQLTIHRPPRYLLHVDAAVLSPYRYTG